MIQLSSRQSTLAIQEFVWLRPNSDWTFSVDWWFFAVLLWLILMLGTPIRWMISLFKVKFCSMRNRWHFWFSYFSKFNLRQIFLKYAPIFFSGVFWLWKYCIAPGQQTKVSFWGMVCPTKRKICFISTVGFSLIHQYSLGWSAGPSID